MLETLDAALRPCSFMSSTRPMAAAPPCARLVSASLWKWRDPPRKTGHESRRQLAVLGEVVEKIAIFKTAHLNHGVYEAPPRRLGRVGRQPRA